MAGPGRQASACPAWASHLLMYLVLMTLCGVAPKGSCVASAIIPANPM